MNGLKKLHGSLLAKRQTTVLAHKGVQTQKFSKSFTLSEENVNFQ